MLVKYTHLAQKSILGYMTFEGTSFVLLYRLRWCAFPKRIPGARSAALQPPKAEHAMWFRFLLFKSIIAEHYLHTTPSSCIRRAINPRFSCWENVLPMPSNRLSSGNLPRSKGNTLVYRWKQYRQYRTASLLQNRCSRESHVKSMSSSLCVVHWRLSRVARGSSSDSITSFTSLLRLKGL